MQVLFAAAEAEPFAKIGGLGDVGSSLPRAIRKLDCDIRVILPQYASIPPDLQKEMRHLTSFTVNLGWRKQYCGLREMTYQGVPYYFIDNEYYFKRDQIYGYADDGERFAFFSKAVWESLSYIKDFQPDVIHCNDWHTALIPALIREHDPGKFPYDRVKSVFTVHNLQYQGIFPKDVLGDLLSLDEKSPGARNMEFYGAVNFLKGALLSADFITTVSPAYGGEIMDPLYGEGLDAVLRQRKDRVRGILNGIDEEKYNPRTDRALVAHAPAPSWKEKNKGEVQALFRLPVKKEAPLLAIVSRLVDQKGLDLLQPVMDELLRLEIQMVVLGTGEKRYEELFSSFAARYPEKIGVKLLFDEEMARKIYGGADLLLMPSRFEPCGLAQMMAMRYGTLPLVRETGGLKDSVIPYRQENRAGNGFAFGPYDAQALLSAVQKAVELFYRDREAWQGLQESAMHSDFSWEKSARKYIALYEDILTTE